MASRFSPFTTRIILNFEKIRIFDASIRAYLPYVPSKVVKKDFAFACFRSVLLSTGSKMERGWSGNEVQMFFFSFYLFFPIIRSSLCFVIKTFEQFTNEWTAEFHA